VYKGINTISKEVVAIKAIDVERIAKTNNRKQLDQEVAVMKGMKHDNILELYDVYPSPVRNFIFHLALVSISSLMTRFIV